MSVTFAKQCVKCDKEGTLAGVDPKKAVYCKTCFITAVKHKFASAIGKRRLFKDGNRREVLVVYEGNQQSAFLLSLISQGLVAEKQKRLVLIPTVLVLITATDSKDVESVIASVHGFQNIIRTKWLFVHIASVLESITAEKIENFCGEKSLDDWNILLESSANLSVRLELISLLRDLLVVRVARCLNIDKVMMADCAEVLARKALESLAFARASSVAHLTDVVDKRFIDVSIIRPLRDVCLKEIAILNRFEGNDRYLFFTESAAANFATEKSVHSITSDFFDRQLVEGFRGVLSTVLSTTSKLRSPVTGTIRCPLCYFSFRPFENERFCYACSSIMKEIFAHELIERILSFDD